MPEPLKVLEESLATYLRTVDPTDEERERVLEHLLATEASKILSPSPASPVTMRLPELRVAGCLRTLTRYVHDHEATAEPEAARDIFVQLLMRYRGSDHISPITDF